MDLNTITAILQPEDRRGLGPLAEGDAFLAGGTWLFSEPQPKLTRLVDLTTLGWEPLVVTPEGLEIAATCTFAQLVAFSGTESGRSPPSPLRGGAMAGWSALPLFRQCCRALLGSFKVWNQATVGGNLCLALPGGPMAALFSALDATFIVWTPDGGERRIPAIDFVIGDNRNTLLPDEVLRAIHVPSTTLKRRTAFRQISLSPLGRSAALLIGARDEDDFSLTVTASTVRPVQLRFSGMPVEAELLAAIERAIPKTLYHDDVHGRPDWRRHVTRLLAREIRDELARETTA